MADHKNPSTDSEQTPDENNPSQPSSSSEKKGEEPSQKNLSPEEKLKDAQKKVEEELTLFKEKLEKGKNGPKTPKKPKTSSHILFIVFASLMLIILFGQDDFSGNEGELKPGEFWDKLDARVIRTAKMEGNIIRGELNEGDIREYYVTFPATYLIEGKRYSEELKREVPVMDYIVAKVGKDHWIYVESDPVFLHLLSIFGPWFLIFIFIYFFFIRGMRNNGMGGGGILSFGRSRAKLHMKERTGVTFNDVAGVEEAKSEVQEIVAFLKSPEKFQRLGGRIPRGVLLVGSPGCGKTLLAKAIAGEADVPFYSISGSDFVEMFVGVGASRVRDLFKQAKENSPCIIFLDEIDAVGRRRGGGLGGGNDEREQTLNAILVEMDGFDSDSGIVLIAATNRPDVLDPALLRPGRFDRQVVIDMPDAKGREEILKVHAKKVKLDPDLDLKVVAQSTPSFSGADLAAVINEAALLAALRNKDYIESDDLEEARDKVKWGRQRAGRVMDDEDRLVTAYHEAGHAVVAASLHNMDPVYKVTIIPRGMALGATMQIPVKDEYQMGKRKLEGMIRVLFGGRLAEDIFCQDITTGASNDIERATSIARRMITEWGMSDKIGPINYSSKEHHSFLGTETQRSREHSEQTSLLIDQEIQRIILEAQEDTRKILMENKEGVELIAQNLMKYEVLSGAEVTKLLKGELIDEARILEAKEREEKRKRLREEDIKKTAEEQKTESAEKEPHSKVEQDTLHAQE